jgi:formylglycine-generating enzyme required for sulfatase activity
VKVVQASATVVSEVAPAPQVAPAPAPLPQPRTLQSWCEVIAESPDPSVVTDAQGRARMLATGLPWKVLDKKTGIVMLLCPPGSFIMGSPASELDRRAGEVQHRRTIDRPFYLGRTVVTQEQWQHVMGPRSKPFTFRITNGPVEGVSWDDCQRFCNGVQMRLPSEAEWEYACRAGTTTSYSFGSKAMKTHFCFDSQAPVPCGSLPPNHWGFREMHGNVYEWVEDAYAEYLGDVGGQGPCWSGPWSYRVVRGGSWSGNASSARSASRHAHAPDFAINSIGFRVARSPSRV